MKPESFDRRQRVRRKRAWAGAVLSTAFQILSALALLWVRGYAAPGGFLEGAALFLAVADLLLIIPTWVVLIQRLKEIKGGEEDAAAQY